MGGRAAAVARRHVRTICGGGRVRAAPRRGSGEHGVDAHGCRVWTRRVEAALCRSGSQRSVDALGVGCRPHGSVDALGVGWRPHGSVGILQAASTPARLPS
eukprot:261794-Chlamydomonas_euryale.AAC.1